MGIRGLTTFLTENTDLYFKPYELYDCHLIVDGSGIACQLYNWVSTSYSAFGGDYDEYYRTVRDFFSMLKKCNVTPIVLFDGGYKKEKLKTTLARARQRVVVLKSLVKEFSTTKIFPLFMKQTFCDVMEEMDIFCIQCESEADLEIATVAKSLNCPVLSYDSDFFIFDVLYIPFSTVHKQPVKFKDKEKYYVNCLIFDQTLFFNEFSGLDKSMMPFVATLLGNDYINGSVFEKFLCHVQMPQSKNKSYNQRKVQGVLHWLKKENVESATKLILSHLEDNKTKSALKAINQCIKDYTKPSTSKFLLCDPENSNISVNENAFCINLPPEIIHLYCKCRIHKFIVDMITLQTYITPQQVENVTRLSTHLTCISLIKELYVLLNSGSQKEGSLKIYLTIGSVYRPVKKKNFSSSKLENISLIEILKEPEDIRLKYLCKVVQVTEDDLNIVPKSNWSVFVISIIYWIKELDKCISLAQIHAIILMAISNQIVQPNFNNKTFSSYRKKHKSLFAKLKETPPIEKKKADNFEEMLANVSLSEKLLFEINMTHLRAATDQITGRGYCFSSIHSYSCFQTCLYHIMQLNALLNYPLPHLKINEFYSGTLLCNLCSRIEGQIDVRKFGSNLLKSTPNLNEIYIYLSEKLCKYSTRVPLLGKKPRKKKKKNKYPMENLYKDEIEIYEKSDNSSDDGEYSDDSNPYSTLLHNTDY